MLCLKKKLRKLLEELLDQKLLERLGGESKNEKLYITGNLFAKGCTFSGPVNFGGGAAQAQPVSYSDEQVAQAIKAICGEGLALDEKQKWAGVYWYLRWAAGYPLKSQEFCERIDRLPFTQDLPVKCNVNNIRRLVTTQLMSQDARDLGHVRPTRSDEQLFAQLRPVVVALARELGKTV